MQPTDPSGCPASGLECKAALRKHPHVPESPRADVQTIQRAPYINHARMTVSITVGGRLHLTAVGEAAIDIQIEKPVAESAL